MYCIPKEKIEKFKKIFKDLGDNQIDKLTKMSWEERAKLFEKQLSKDEASLLNKSFEKSVASKKIRALGDWVQKNLDEKYRDASLKKELVFAHKNFDTVEQVDSYISSKVNGLAEKAQGVGLTNKEMAKFTKLGETFYNTTREIGNDLGKSDKLAENIKWGESYKALAEYTDELMPKSLIRGLLQKYGRASMLASWKTPFLNVESNTINAVTEAIVRRAKAGSVVSSVERGVEKEYIKFANKMFKETGIDFTRMISLEDTVTGINRVVGEKSQNIGVKPLDNVSDFVFNTLLTTPDVAFSSVAFTDSLALQASKMAGGDAKLATKLFKEATEVGARGRAGVLREIAIADARLATYTNDSWSAKASEQLRDFLNKAGIGDWVMPFIKTPANVAELGADYAGLGVVKGGIAIGKHFMTGKKIDRLEMRSAMSDIVRSGLGMVVAYTLATLVKPENFNAAYDPRKVKINQIGNLGYNAVKMKTPFGERWMSTDYLGPLGVPFVAMMYAKKYKNKGTGYVTGATTQYLNQLPLIDGAKVFDYLQKLTNPNENSMGRVTSSMLREMGDGISARLIPGISYDLARATDSVQRDTHQKKFVVHTPLFDMNFDKFMQKIPYLGFNEKYSKKGLPMKTDTLGRIMYESTPLESMLFGARDRVARTDKLTGEILRLRDAGQTPSIKDLRFSHSAKVDELKEKVGKDKFIDVARNYGERMAVEFDKEINRKNRIKVGRTSYAPYEQMSDEVKKKRLYDIGQKLYEKVLKENGIKYR